jgi:hypothetical protein
MKRVYSKEMFLPYWRAYAYHDSVIQRPHVLFEAIQLALTAKGEKKGTKNVICFRLFIEIIIISGTRGKGAKIK